MSPSAPTVAAAGSCELIWVEGPDATSFLQGLLTNDVAGLEPGASCHALMLDNTGHIRADMRVVRTGDEELTLVVEPGHGAPVVELLDEYHFSEDVDIIGPEPFELLTVAGPAPAAVAGADLTIPGRVPGTHDLIGADAGAIATQLGVDPSGADRLETMRIAAGVPRFGVDHTAANLVQETGLEGSAVSFEKGCYLGQETVARVRYRGQVNRRLVGIALEGTIPAGTGLLAGGRTVGAVTSIAGAGPLGAIGLAIVRREVPEGAVLDLDGVPGSARVVGLPFTGLQGDAARAADGSA